MIKPLMCWSQKGYTQIFSPLAAITIIIVLTGIITFTCRDRNTGLEVIHLIKSSSRIYCLQQVYVLIISTCMHDHV